MYSAISHDWPTAALHALRRPRSGGITPHSSGISLPMPALAFSMSSLPTGHAALDALLPGGGWPRGALCELLVEQVGREECALLLPALTALTRARQRVAVMASASLMPGAIPDTADIDRRHLVFVDAAGSDSHWRSEQCLRSGGCGAVLDVLPRADYAQLRQMQRAAESSGAIGFVFRPLQARRQASPCALRVSIQANRGLLQVELLGSRRRGDRGGSSVQLG